MVFSWLDAESSALTAIVLSGSTAYDDEGAIGTNDTTSAILKITRKAISEMRVLFFTETTSNRRKMLHQTCANSMGGSIGHNPRRAIRKCERPHFRRRAAANAARKAREKAQPKANLKQPRFLTSPCRLRHARTAAILRKRQAAPRAHALDRKSRPDRRGGHGRALIGVNLSSQAARC